MSHIPQGGTLLLIHSHYGTPPDMFLHAQEQGLGRIRREIDLSGDDFAQASGLITTTHLDQLGFLRWSAEVEALLDRGGRWFFNGHILRPLIEGLRIYQPIPQAKRSDLVLRRLSPHPLFEGIDMASLEENKGVAGFYGRGHNPMPAGAVAVTGIGPQGLALDWDWARPRGGRMFSHAGNDVGSMRGVNPTHAVIAPRILDWTAGGVNA